MIAIIDCESCDTRGIAGAFEHLGVEAVTTGAVEAIDRASKLVLPPCKSFPRMIRSLRDRQLVGPLLNAAAAGRPILGISQGMHLLFDVSYLDGQHTGLGLIHGKVIGFDFGQHPAAQHFTIPHQGWNQVNWDEGCPLTAGLRSGEYFYFHHQGHAEPLDEAESWAQCNHGIDFTALIWKGHVFGTQFLPEKSEDAGLQLLASFAAM